MRRWVLVAVALAVLVGAIPWPVPGMFVPAFAGVPRKARKLPEFRQPDPTHWINSEPLKVADLAGNVLLVGVWTFG